MRTNKGFTLVEMAVVLVIIGIILGAVIKGNDLIENAKVKGVIQAPTKWEVPIMTFYDKKGYFPGDQIVAPATTRDGLIDDFAALVSDLNTAGIAHPDETKSISDVSFDIKSLTTPCNITKARNVMILSGLTIDSAKALDASIDGAEDGEKGRIRICGTAGTTAAATWAATTTDPVALTYFFDKLP